jgi:hypothetical protein
MATRHSHLRILQCQHISRTLLCPTLKSGAFRMMTIDKSGAYVMPLRRFFHGLFS